MVIVAKKPPIDPFEMPVDHRTWNHFWQQVCATVVVDAILSDVFQGKRDEQREHMLDVAARHCRRIDWGPPGDIDEKQREALLRQAREIAEARRS